MRFAPASRQVIDLLNHCQGEVDLSTQSGG